MESLLDTLKQKKALAEGLDLDRIRAGVNRMIDRQLKERNLK